ncbi:MAG: archease [Candidatus Omnitrophica bacterium]|nr:archease [Candidatus Omnitrophota bacterium]
MKRYEQISHTADLAAKVYGKDLAELFENAAFAMMDMSAELEGLRKEEKRQIELDSAGKEDLLIDWLNEVLYTSVSEKILFLEFRVNSIEDDKLAAEIIGQSVGDDTDRINIEIKAATYHEIKIEENASGYEVTVVFDV